MNQTIYCPNCGTANVRAATRCVSCSAALPVDAGSRFTPPPAAAVQKKGFSFVTAIFLLGLIPNPIWIITAPIGITLAVLSYKQGWGK